jgi:Domain of unknown function (DUF1772)
MTRRISLTRTLLWVSVFAWGILLGSKLFDLRVLAGAWSASPPESLSLLPYGSHYPVDTGQYFFPISAPLLVCSLATLIAGWRTPPSYRVWLVLSPLMMVAIFMFTVLWFWPHNHALWLVATGAPDAVRDRTEIIRMARQWVSYDWLRVAMMVVGFVSAIRTISVPFPAPAAAQNGR